MIWAALAIETSRSSLVPPNNTAILNANSPPFATVDSGCRLGLCLRAIRTGALTTCPLAAKRQEPH
jgi:hypothetical protein